MPQTTICLETKYNQGQARTGSPKERNVRAEAPRTRMGKEESTDMSNGRLAALKQKLRNREKVFATTSGMIGWSGVIQKYRSDALDLVIFDLEHGFFTLETVEQMLRMCRVLDIPSVVRVGDTRYDLISKAFDVGADGIMLPRVESVEQLERALSYAKFPPLGKKGCGGFSLLRPGETTASFNEDRITLVQIESPAGIESLPGMIGKFGAYVDGIVVGPTDLSISVGQPLQYTHPEVQARINQVLDICREHQKSCGLYLDTFEEIAHWRKQGMNILWSGLDIGFLAKAYNELAAYIGGLA